MSYTNDKDLFIYKFQYTYQLEFIDNPYKTILSLRLKHKLYFFRI